MSVCQSFDPRWSDSDKWKHIGTKRSFPLMLDNVELLFSARQGHTSLDTTYIVSLLEMLNKSSGEKCIKRVHADAVIHMAQQESYQSKPSADHHVPLLMSTTTKDIKIVPQIVKEPSQGLPTTISDTE